MASDIDIDFADRRHILDHISHITARQTTDGRVRTHNSGVYVTEIPWDPVNQCAAFDYQVAEQRGYFKIDFLNVSVYQLIRDQQHYQEALDREPNWSRLWLDSEWASKIIHVGGHTGLLNSMKPDSITRMAAFISIIRPGKAHLQNQPWDTIMQQVWDGDDSRGFVFKKSHAISYATLVALHMNLLDFTD